MGTEVDKIYALNGNDLVRSDSGNFIREKWTLDESGTFPFFKVDTSASLVSAECMKAQALQYLMRAGHTSYLAAAAGVNMVSGDGNVLVPFSAYIPGAVQARAFAIEGFYADSGLNKYRIATPDGTYDPTSGAGGQVRFWDVGTPYADWAAVAAYVDTTNRQVTTWNNGAVITGPTNTDSSGFAWASGTFDPTANLMQFLMGGATSGGATTRYNKQKVAEVWHVSGATSAQGLAISQRLDTLYS